eukprot:scaffold21567_cov103-Cylindrotheca_fusiformis.AAC.2
MSYIVTKLASAIACPCRQQRSRQSHDNKQQQKRICQRGQQKQMSEGDHPKPPVDDDDSDGHLRVHHPV